MDAKGTSLGVSKDSDTPWLSGPVQWENNKLLVRRAVIWLSLEKCKKSILRLSEQDYNDHKLGTLVAHYQGVHNLNREVFKHLQSSITGWPGGFPSPDFDPLPAEERKSRLAFSQPFGNTVRTPQDYMSENYARHSNPHIKNKIFPKKILIFSPHPDDDVISMGGTLIRLVEQGHRVHVAYQTSGNYAVWDDDVTRFVDFAHRLNQEFGFPTEALEKLEKEIEASAKGKIKGDMDSLDVLKVKGTIRETEARAAARFCGVHKRDIHFLNLPFYESGKRNKNPLGDKDISIVYDLLQKIQPHQIYCAGDLLDPHGTHRVCLSAIVAALKKVKTEEWFSESQVWMYRGAWEEFSPHEITMAVPMSPDEMLQKRYAIFKHQSQKDPPPFAGNDKREFWQRSEARNRETAALYDRLGLTEYEGVEAFVEFDINDENSPFQV